MQFLAVCGGAGPALGSCEANGVPACTYAEVRRALQEGDAKSIRQVIQIFTV